LHLLKETNPQMTGILLILHDIHSFLKNDPLYERRSNANISKYEAFVKYPKKWIMAQFAWYLQQ
jgi:hypothetical protein